MGLVPVSCCQVRCHTLLSLPAYTQEISAGTLGLVPERACFTGSHSSLHLLTQACVFSFPPLCVFPLLGAGGTTVLATHSWENCLFHSNTDLHRFQNEEGSAAPSLWGKTNISFYFRNWQQATLGLSSSQHSYANHNWQGHGVGTQNQRLQPYAKLLPLPTLTPQSWTWLRFIKLYVVKRKWRSSLPINTSSQDHLMKLSGRRSG